MRIAFTGHRNREAKTADLDQIPRDAVWVHGGARGFDTQVDEYAREHGIELDVIRPDYARLGDKAPLIRDRQIVDGCDVVYALYDGRPGGGTAYTVRYALSHGKQVIVIPDRATPTTLQLPATPQRMLGLFSP